MEKGNEPVKWTYEKGNKSLKADSSERDKNSKVDIWIFLSPRASDTISYRSERMQ